MYAAWPTSSARIRSGSTTGSSAIRDVPRWLQTGVLPVRWRVVSVTLRVPARAAAGSGCGVRSSQIPPSAVAAIRYRSSSPAARPSPDCAESLPPREPAGHGAELVDREQDLPVLAAGRGIAGQDVDDRAGLRLGHADLGGALEDAVPGVGVAEAAGPVESAAQAAQQGAEPQRDVAGLPGRRPDQRQLRLLL